MNLQQISTLVGQELLRRQQRLITVESCTGGSIAQVITAIAGSSAWFEGGFITYSNASKVALVGVSAAVLASAGAVSAEVVEAMVAGGCQRIGAQWGVAVSGVAGPGGGTPDKPVGTVYIAWQDGKQYIWSCRFFFEGDREEVRLQTVQAALQGLLSALRSYPW
ncbi:MAG TPA: CinA family protein [Gammaproteobacteria bacterium]|nr:CinA family protein [Gammaproteobacteria bacterium]